MLGRRRERERDRPTTGLGCKTFASERAGLQMQHDYVSRKRMGQGPTVQPSRRSKQWKEEQQARTHRCVRVPREGEDLTSSGLEACSTKRGFYLSCPAEGGPRQQSPRPAHYPDVYHRQVNKLQQRNRSVTKQAKIPSKIIVGSEIKRFRFLSGQESQTDDRLEICFGSL